MNSILDEAIPASDSEGKHDSHTPSIFQEAIYERVETSQDSILVQAVAGSGKTTTIVAAVRKASGRSLFLAFNKSIAEELRGRIGQAGDCKTLNALGHRLMMTQRPKAQLDADKLKKLARRIIPSDDFSDWSYAAIRAVGLAKNNAVGIGEEWDWTEIRAIIDAYLDVPAEKIDAVANYATRMMRESINDTQTFDFDDQLYIPIKENWAYPHYDNVFVDEAQDLSPIQHLMLAAMHDSRIIAVGDRHQAIYGFRGASHESMDILKDRFKMVELPLSITYRCPQSVVALAQRYCPTIMAREGAPNGTVAYREEEIDPETQLLQYADPRLFQRGLVLCRTNSPLFKAILRHIRAKEPCRVLSSFIDSFQSSLKSLVRNRRGGWEGATSAEALQRLDRWYERECEAADGRRGKLAYLEDKYNTMKLLLEEYSTVKDCVEAVRKLGQSREGPTFATVHKAKGLEAQHVYILRPDLMPSPWASGDDERLQEDNLSYVAITRALDTLTFGVKERR